MSASETLITELATAVTYLLETGARGGLEKSVLVTFAGRIEKALADVQNPAPTIAPPAKADVKPTSLPPLMGTNQAAMSVMPSVKQGTPSTTGTK